MGKNQLLSWKWFALLLLDFAVMAMLSYMQLKA